MKLFSKKGFTLIELLVVIAVLGVLAAAVVAAINPVAKINSAKDADTKSDISQIAGAMQSYYTAKASAGTPYYPHRVIDLTPLGTPAENELKSEPKTPAGISYTVILKPAGCTTGAQTCTDIAVYAISNVTAGSYICWDSTSSIVKVSASVPVAGTATCP